MRAVIQRVTGASVTGKSRNTHFGPDLISQIGRGFCVLVGITTDDTEADMDALAKKLLSVRLFPDPDGNKQWAKSVTDLQLEILCVSQFTLLTRAQNLTFIKASFNHARLPTSKWKAHAVFFSAMKSDTSKEFYDKFLAKLRSSYQEDKIKDGVFGAMMSVDIKNDGPVTLLLDSKGQRAGKEPWTEGLI
ncbi:hypothetical protein SmJEL517_g01032 [Synchytrium microbalum]|uniref:D-aminoacyl-tRNA deacylase n=1 Tax=Synchytrium microbalum TaxID=1806994 RepID=A0A507CHQ9_9FUNG|nr:uncharacterized protein SmJEL517_g01032 [Synchytrium microbalum]TPX37143.1 hypothetical protein SmJEL517_g01032 [Synchytrium microbalum]